MKYLVSHTGISHIGRSGTDLCNENKKQFLENPESDYLTWINFYALLYVLIRIVCSKPNSKSEKGVEDLNSSIRHAHSSLRAFLAILTALLMINSLALIAGKALIIIEGCTVLDLKRSCPL